MDAPRMTESPDPIRKDDLGGFEHVSVPSNNHEFSDGPAASEAIAQMQASYINALEKRLAELETKFKHLGPSELSEEWQDHHSHAAQGDNTGRESGGEGSEKDAKGSNDKDRDEDQSKKDSDDEEEEEEEEVVEEVVRSERSLRRPYSPGLYPPSSYGYPPPPRRSGTLQPYTDTPMTEELLLEIDYIDVEEYVRNRMKNDRLRDKSKLRTAIQVIRRTERVHVVDGSRMDHSDGQTSHVSPGVADKLNTNIHDRASVRDIPVCVEIRSMLLTAVLSDLSKINLFPRPGALEFSPLLLLNPFKLIAVYEQELRDYTVDLAEKLQRVSERKKKKGEKEEKSKDGEKNKEDDEDKKAPQSDTKKDDKPVQKEDDDDDNIVFAGWETDRCVDELKLLMKVFDTDLKPTLDLHKAAAAGGLQDVSFQELWHVFQLGEAIICPSLGNQTARVLCTGGGGTFKINPAEISQALYGFDNYDDAKPETRFGQDFPKNTFLISCFVYDYDGRSFGPVQHLIPIAKFEGRRPIMSLPCFPISYLKTNNHEVTRESLIERGKIFFNMIKATNVIHKRYVGLTVNDIREQVDSEVIVDTRMALLKHPNWTPKFRSPPSLTPSDFETKIDSYMTTEYLAWFRGCRYHIDIMMDDYRRQQYLDGKALIHEDVEDMTSLEDDDYLICSNRVFGFILRSRKWAALSLDRVQDIVYQDTGFDFLVLPEGHDSMLLALVKTHKTSTVDEPFRSGVRQMDIVRGKGKGLIILLHGEPGVGKTSTAECIAQYTSRPLFQITCGDIGETAEVVEERLETNFQLAQRWGCVLLLDEADVFLMARDKADFTRNALVSVFLRVLEYYSGILFLTTNRIGTFDHAFRSRIHMSLFYPRLDERATIKIWQNNLNRVKEVWSNSLTIREKEEKAIIEFAKEHYNESLAMRATWNGRQIRNAFQTAIALAEFEAEQCRIKYNLPETPPPSLEASHFMSVAKASTHFDQYLIETQGSAGDVARERGERRDDLGADLQQQQPQQPQQIQQARPKFSTPRTTRMR